jgi:hypothetical protein
MLMKMMTEGKKKCPTTNFSWQSGDILFFEVLILVLKVQIHWFFLYCFSIIINIKIYCKLYIISVVTRGLWFYGHRVEVGHFWLQRGLARQGRPEGQACTQPSHLSVRTVSHTLLRVYNAAYCRKVNWARHLLPFLFFSFF